MKFKDMNTPNKLTTIRMICVPVVIVLFILYALHLSLDIPCDYAFISYKAGSLTITQLLIFILFVGASITDFIDGNLARKNNIVTDYGKIMDPLADKLLVNSSLVCLAVFGFCFPYVIPNADKVWMLKTMSVLRVVLLFIIVLVIFRDFFVDSLRMQSVKNGVVVPASKWGKFKTATLMPGIAFLILGSLHFVLFILGAVLLILGGIFACISGVQYYLSIMPTLDNHGDNK